MPQTPRTRARTLSARALLGIRVEMARQDINQTALSRLLGEKQAWLSRRMTGAVEITLGDLDRIAHTLDVDPLDLLDGARDDDGLRAVGGGYPRSDRRREPNRRKVLERPRPLARAA